MQRWLLILNEPACGSIPCVIGRRRMQSGDALECRRSSGDPARFQDQFRWNRKTRLRRVAHSRIVWNRMVKAVIPVHYS